jgi:hypothetical protein
MQVARVFSAAAGALAIGAGVAACGGSFGSGSTMPTTLSSPNFGVTPTPSPTPSAQSNILTIGTSTAFQTLPEIGGYSGQIAFPAVAPDTPPPKGTPNPSPSPVSIAIGATLSVVKPNDGPDLNLESGTGSHKKTRERPARALAYLELLPTHDVTLASYPRITLDIPREIASQYRDGEFGLALWNSGEKDSAYRLAVAEIDAVATPPPATVRKVVAQATVTATASSSASAVPSATPSLPPPLMRNVPPGMGGNVPVAGPNGVSAPPGAAAPTPAPTATLPPERILFAGTATSLKLIANRPAIFALYALPHPRATPAPSAAATSAPAAGSSSAPTPAAGSAPATASASKAP